jgi:hypothetical protein
MESPIGDIFYSIESKSFRFDDLSRLASLPIRDFSREIDGLAQAFSLIYGGAAMKSRGRTRFSTPHNFGHALRRGKSSRIRQ